MYICKRCSNPVSAGSPFCLTCGTPVEVDLDTAATPAPAAAAPAVPEDPTVAAVKKYLHYIAVGLAVLALVMSVLNLFGLFDVTAVASMNGNSQTSSGPVTDVYEAKPMVLIANIIYGLISLFIALVGAAYYLKAAMNNDLYDKYISKIGGKLLDGRSVLSLMGILGAASVLLQWILYLFTIESETIRMFSVTMEMTARLRIHWTSWVMLGVYLVVACADLFWLSKKQK